MCNVSTIVDTTGIHEAQVRELTCLTAEGQRTVARRIFCQSNGKADSRRGSARNPSASGSAAQGAAVEDTNGN
jgi:hypothetical protein